MYFTSSLHLCSLSLYSVISNGIYGYVYIRKNVPTHSIETTVTDSDTIRAWIELDRSHRCLRIEMILKTEDATLIPLPYGWRLIYQTLDVHDTGLCYCGYEK